MRIGPNWASTSATTTSTWRARCARSASLWMTQVAAASLSASGAWAPIRGARVLGGEPIARRSSRASWVSSDGRDDDQSGEPGVGVVLDQERGLVEHDLGAGLLRVRDRARAGRRDPRVGDPVEVGARCRVAERDRAQPLAVEPALGRQDRRAEPRDQLGQRRLARLDDRARELVGVDHRRAAVGQQLGDRALARRDPAGQPDARTPSRRPVTTAPRARGSLPPWPTRVERSPGRACSSRSRRSPGPRSRRAATGRAPRHAARVTPRSSPHGRRPHTPRRARGSPHAPRRGASPATAPARHRPGRRSRSRSAARPAMARAPATPTTTSCAIGRSRARSGCAISPGPRRARRCAPAATRAARPPALPPSDGAGSPESTAQPTAMKARPRAFVISAAKPDEFPPPSRCPSSRSSGRSNVGKSSLINTLVGQPALARTSRTPGRTRLVNWFEVGQAASTSSTCRDTATPRSAGRCASRGAR